MEFYPTNRISKLSLKEVKGSYFLTLACVSVKTTFFILTSVASTNVW